MDTINISNIKLKKANAIRKHHQLQKIANVFRVVEICIVLALISRFSIHLPIAVKNSSEYFKGLTVVLISPGFVFIVGNAIVITLFAKSGQFSGQDSTGKGSRNDFYQEFIEKSEKNQCIYRYETEYREKQDTSDKYVITEDPFTAEGKKSYQRSQSENFEKPNCNESITALKRSVSEKFNKKVGSGKGLVKKSYPEDNMSNEEFRSTIESFIARQKRFRIDEEKSMF